MISLNDENVFEAYKRHIAKLEEARDLLEEVWNEYGAYGRGEISLATRVKLHRFFKFDDSE